MTAGVLPFRAPTRAADAGRARTSWSMGASVALHVLVLLLLVFAPRPPAPQPPVTEITLLEPGDAGEAAPAAASAAVMSSTPVPGAAAESDRDQRFRRAAERAPLEPSPQRADAADDRIVARLAAMQSQGGPVSAGIAVAAPVSPWSAAPAVVAGAGDGGASRVALTRGGGTGGAPLALARGGGAAVGVPVPALAPAPRVERASAPAGGGDVAARRTLAGATLMGPIADRAVLVHVTPVYPEWAKRDAVEGSVTLYFVVLPDGTVRDNVAVQRTAGFGEFDDNAVAALRAWRFAPLEGGRVGEQWGTITFRFRLRDAE